jgi:uncharacterized protein
MNGIDFEQPPSVVVSAPTRTDIACFAGFVRRRSDRPVPASVTAWWRDQGWKPDPIREATLLNVPVPIDTWDVFDWLFEWDKRPLDETGQYGTTYLGAAVRSFFAQGGRKCYVLRVGDPWALTAPGAERRAKIRLLLPGFDPATAAELEVSGTADQPAEEWEGIANLYGLPDVSFFAFPDLCDAVAEDRQPFEPPELRIDTEEQFKECAEPDPEPPRDLAVRRFTAPRCGDDGFRLWMRAIRMAGRFIAGARTGGSRMLREVQLVAAVPLPAKDSEADRGLFAFLQRTAFSTDLGQGSGIASAFVQLAFPWVRTAAAQRLPEQLESPDGILAGILAGNALSRGTFACAANMMVPEIYDLEPALRRDEQEIGPATTQTLVQRVSLFGRRPAGFKLLSDVTTSPDRIYRHASVNRLISVILRTARILGEGLAFENSGEELWGQLKETLEHLLEGLWLDGALRGETPAEAFQVRCDRSTMSQSDLDNGRVIARIDFTASLPIEGITVVLAMDEGGQVSLLSADEN